MSIIHFEPVVRNEKPHLSENSSSNFMFKTFMNCSFTRITYWHPYTMCESTFLFLWWRGEPNILRTLPSLARFINLMNSGPIDTSEKVWARFWYRLFSLSVRTSHVVLSFFSSSTYRPDWCTFVSLVWYLNGVCSFAMRGAHSCRIWPEALTAGPGAEALM